MTTRFHAWACATLLAAFVSVAGLYSVVNPLFEAPDEIWHYEYVRWLAEGHGLPRPADVGTAPWRQEGSQPPLYYLLAAVLTLPFSTENAATAIRYNPHAAVGQPAAVDNYPVGADRSRHAPRHPVSHSPVPRRDSNPKTGSARDTARGPGIPGPDRSG